MADNWDWGMYFHYSGHSMRSSEYIMVDDETLQNCIKLTDFDNDIEDIDGFTLDDIQTYLEKKSIESFHSDVLVNGDPLYFLLNGIIPDSYEEIYDIINVGPHFQNNYLHNAIYGRSQLYIYDQMEITFTEKDILPEILKTLEDINITEIEKNFDLDKFKEMNIYPYRWDIYDKRKWLDALISEYNDLLDFYRKAKEKNVHIIKISFGQPEYFACEEKDEDEES